MAFSIIQDETSGAFKLWDGKDILPMPGPVLEHEATGNRSVDIGGTLVPFDSINAWMTQKKALEAVTDNFGPPPGQVEKALQKGQAEVAARPPSLGQKLLDLPMRYARGAAGFVGSNLDFVKESQKAYEEAQKADAEAKAPGRTARHYIEGLVKGGSFGTFTGLEDIGKAVKNSFIPPPFREADYLKSPETLKPTTPQEAWAQREGEITGGIATGKPVYKGIAAGANALKVPKVLQPFAAGNVIGAAGPLAQGDLGTAAEQAGAMGATALVGQAGAKALGKVAALPKDLEIRRWAKELGSGRGVQKAINEQIAAGKWPSAVEQPYNLFNEPTNVAEAGQTLQAAGHMAGEKVREVSSSMRDESIRLSHGTGTVTASPVDEFRNIIGDTPGVLQSATEKRLGRLADQLSTEGERIGGRGIAGASPETLDQIRAKLNLQPAGRTFEELVNLREDLGKIRAVTDPDKKVMKLAIAATDKAVDQFGSKAPDALRAYRDWQRFYRTQVGPFYGEEAPIRNFTNRPYGEFEKPASKVIPELVNMAPEQIGNVMQAVRKGPHGAAAADNISAGAYQHLYESALDTATQQFSPKKFIKTLNTPELARKYEAALGDRYGDAVKFKDALMKVGLADYKGEPGAVKYMAGYHLFTAGQQLGAMNPMGIWHGIRAGTILIAPKMFYRMIENDMGRKLLAEGLLQKPGTPRAELIQNRITKVAMDLGGKDEGPLPDPDLLPPGGPGPRGLPSPAIAAGPPGEGRYPEYRSGRQLREPAIAAKSPGEQPVYGAKLLPPPVAPPIRAEPGQFTPRLNPPPIYQGAPARAVTPPLATPPVILQGTGQRALPPGSNPPANSARQAAQVFESDRIVREAAGMANVESKIQMERSDAATLVSHLRDLFPERGGPRVKMDAEMFSNLENLTSADHFPQNVRTEAQKVLDRYSMLRPAKPISGFIEPPFVGPRQAPPPGELPLAGRAPVGAPSPVMANVLTPPVVPPKGLFTRENAGSLANRADTNIFSAMKLLDIKVNPETLRTEVATRFPSSLRSKTGVTPDEAAKQLHEAGYLSEGTDAALFDAAERKQSTAGTGQMSAVNDYMIRSFEEMPPTLDSIAEIRSIIASDPRLPKMVRDAAVERIGVIRGMLRSQ